MSSASSSAIFAPMTLRNGAILPNRLVKAAMEESLAAADQLPDERMFRLYRRWSEGGVGVIITGNVMVHAEALTGPGGIVLDARSPIEPFQTLAREAKSGGAQVWMQINHPGRQVLANMPGVAWGPSAIRVDLGKNTKRLAQPVEMTADQIRETIARFAETARRAELAGFDGVEVHAAHGYLLSQFLSPLVNQRADDWGGALERRARLLLEVVRAIRAVVQPRFTVAVKLNSADFQRGGFDASDARRVIELLAPVGVDVVELSGGNYESPAMSGRPSDDRTVAREAYFLTLAEELARSTPIPLMLTGGIARRPVAEQVLASGIELVGMGTALAVDPDLPTKWRSDADAKVELAPVRIGDKAIASLATMARVRYQIHRMAAGRSPRPTVRPLFALVCDAIRARRALGRYRAWLGGRRALDTSAVGVDARSPARA